MSRTERVDRSAGTSLSVKLYLPDFTWSKMAACALTRDIKRNLWAGSSRVGMRHARPARTAEIIDLMNDFYSW